MLKNLVVGLEHCIKSSLFNCQMCGQCILTYTQMRCPMNCPKGLRNGPCGGTLDGRCEVYPDRHCVWMDIRGAEALANNRQYPVPPVHAPVDAHLFDGSSYLNLLSGLDRETRVPRPYLDLVPAPQQPAPVGNGRLEATLRRGEFAITTECHSPRNEDGLKRIHRFARTVRDHVTAVNTTSNVGGRPTLPSRRTGGILQDDYGLEAIVQICGRDVNAAQFVGELEATRAAGFHNLFCLTGDWNRLATVDLKPGETQPKIAERYFPMDAVQMLYEARHLRETGLSGYQPHRALPHRLLLGGAINPYSTPTEFVVARLRQKLAAGLDFVQTQIVTETRDFARFLGAVRQAGLLRADPAAPQHTAAGDRFYLIPSVPVVTTVKMLDLMCGLAGVRVDADFAARIRGAADPAREGVAAALELALALRRLGVHGLHLMPFGAGGDQIAEIAAAVRAASGPADSSLPQADPPLSPATAMPSPSISSTPATPRMAAV